MSGTSVSGSSSAWNARTISTIEKDLDKVGSDNKYTVKKEDTFYNIAAALKVNNKDIKEDTMTLAKKLQEQAKVADVKHLPPGTVLDIQGYKPKGDSSGNDPKPITFADASAPDFKEKYVPLAVAYMKGFDKNEDKKLDSKELSEAYGFTMTDDMMKNLDLDGNGTVDLKESTLGLLMADASNDIDPSTGKAADGKVDANEQNAFKTFFQAAVDTNAYQANQYTLNEIAKNVDANGKLTKAVTDAYQPK